MVVSRVSAFSRAGVVLVAVVALAMLVAGCGTSTAEGPGGDAADRPVDRDATLSVAIASLPLQKDPLGETVPEVYFRMFSLVYDRLLSIDHEGEIKPMLATKWDYSDNGRTLTLALRDDAEFDDGSPVDADVVAANLRRVADSESPVAEPLAAITEIEATKPHEVRIEMEQPTTQVLEALAMNAGMILHPDLLDGEKAGKGFNGSGPYEVTEFQPGAKIVMTRKDGVEDYWDTEAAQIKTFQVQQMNDPHAVINALKSGQVDMSEVTSSDSADALEAELDSGKLKLQDSIAASWLTLSMNRSIKPMDDIEVRRAVNEALDRTVIVDAFFPGSEPAVQWARADSAYFDDELSYAYDPQAAKDRLAAAGYPDGVDLGTIEVTSAVSKNAAEAVQGMLSEAGIKIDLQVVSPTQVFANFAGGKVAGTINWASGLGKVASVSKMSSNFGPSRIQPGPTDEAMQLLATADDNRLTQEERDATFTELNTYVTEQAWTAPLLWMNFKWAYNANLTGLEGGEFDYATIVGPYDWRYFAVHEE